MQQRCARSLAFTRDGLRRLAGWGEPPCRGTRTVSTPELVAANGVQEWRGAGGGPPPAVQR
eukprot:12702086-Alexandrium_andersonii.AAC.1